MLRSPSGCFHSFAVEFMATLNFKSTGSGKPVVALHGYGSTLFSWRFLPPALPNRRVVRIDLPGHGGSAARPDGRYALSDHARQVINFIEVEDFGEFDLIGHSLGGGVALSIVAELSTRKVSPIKSLTLVDSVALPQSLPWFLGLARVPGLGSFLLSALRRQTIAAALRTAFYDPRRVTEEMLQVYARNLMTREGRQAQIRTARQIFPNDLLSLIESYHRVKLPTLLIWGKQDAIVPPWIGVALNGLIAGSKLVLIDDCGHIPQEERPDVAISAIAEFLSTV
jgi:pimeloyl-ACP methyl ester carboxylesterase